MKDGMNRKPPYHIRAAVVFSFAFEHSAVLTMAFSMCRIIFVIVFSLVFRTNCSLETISKTDNVYNLLDVPLLDSLDAPLKAQLDISKLTKQLEILISNKVRKEVSHACAELVESLVENKTKEAEKTLKTEIYDKITSEESVGFTALGRGQGTQLQRTILKFPDVKSSFGISHLTTLQNNGKFTCEKEGLYLVSKTVMSCSSGDSVFSIHKGNTKVSQYYIGHSSTSSNACNSGTGTILLLLNVSETVYVKTATSGMNVYDRFSSFTVLNVK